MQGLAWEDIPRPLQLWIQKTDGLKIDGIAITSLDELTRIYHLLERKPDKRVDIKDVGAWGLALATIGRYIRRCYKTNPEPIDENLLVRRNEVMALRCSRCGSRLLDDARPRFQALDTRVYVARRFRKGCGSPICKGVVHFAIPYDPAIRWRQSSTKRLQTQPPVVPEWRKHLFRNWDNIGGLPVSVDIIHTVCKESIHKDTKPRWTIGSKPLYVIRVPICKVCNNLRRGPWKPADSNRAYICVPKLSVLWAKVKKGKILLKDVIKCPQAYISEDGQGKRRL